jgi:hypothetical protein
MMLRFARLRDLVFVRRILRPALLALLTDERFLAPYEDDITARFTLSKSRSIDE